jgi:hypothetical protein
MNKEKGGSHESLGRKQSSRMSEKMCSVFLSSSVSNLTTSSKSRRGGKVEDILLYKFRESQSRLERKRKQREEEIMQEVTGKPAINPKSAELAEQKLMKELTNTIKESKFSQSSYEISKYLISSANQAAHDRRRSADPYDIPSSERQTRSPRVHVDIKNRRCSDAYVPVVINDQLKVTDDHGVASPSSLRANILKKFQDTKDAPNFYDMTQSEREKYWIKMKEAKLESQRKLKAEKELEGCTFKPVLETSKQNISLNKSFIKEQNDSMRYSDIHSKKQQLKSRTSQSVPRNTLSREPEAESPELLRAARYNFERTSEIRAPPPNPTSPWPHNFTAAEVQKQVYKGVLGKLKPKEKSQSQVELRISIKSEGDRAPELINTGYYKQLSPAGISYKYKPGANLQAISTNTIQKPTISTIKSISPKPSTSSTKTVISKSSSKKQVRIN